jgi:hypothetical protein
VNPAATPDSFEGKALLVWLQDQPTQFPGGLALEYAELRTVGDRVFLAGRGPSANREDWNVPYLVAWQSVALLLTFASRQELLAEMGSGKLGLLSRLAWAIRGSRS